MTKTISLETNTHKKSVARKQQVIITKSFGYAFYGIFLFLKQERNGKIQMAIAVLVIAYSLALKINLHEWIAVLSCIGAVLSLEMLNSALEKLCDLICEEYHPAIKIIKDVSAGAVLWTTLISVVIAAIIFLPKIMSLCFPNSHA